MADTFLIDDNEHAKGSECDECWPGYPRDCKCGGSMHCSFGDEDWEGNFYLITECDQCGESE